MIIMFYIVRITEAEIQLSLKWLPDFSISFMSSIVRKGILSKTRLIINEWITAWQLIDHP